MRRARRGVRHRRVAALGASYSRPASGQSILDTLTIALKQASGQRLASTFASNRFHFPDDARQFPLELDSRLFSQTRKAVLQTHAVG